MKKSINKDLKRKINPQNINKWKTMRFTLNVISVFIALFAFYLLFSAIKTHQLLLALIGLFCFIYVLSSFLSINPGLYNKIDGKQKIIPLKDEPALGDLFFLLSQIETPYGKTKIGKIGGTNIIVPYYYLEKENFQIFFIIKKGNLVLKAKNLDPYNQNDYNKQQSQTKALTFLQNLTDLCCYIYNTDEIPSEKDLNTIFNEE